LSDKRTPDYQLSLSEVHGTVGIPYQKGILRRLLAISGPAFLVSVGYMDPGNWATDLAAGASFNYTLLWVLLMSNLMAILLQSLAFRLGVVRGLDLAQACRLEYPRWASLPLYVLCEIAISACDLAEVLGSAIALQLLFGLPLIWGVCLTAMDTFALLFLNSFGIRKTEAVIIGLITIVAAGVILQVFLAGPDWGSVARGLIPGFPASSAVYIAIGMLGATVMPHNLYLHSSLVQTRRVGVTGLEKQQAIRLNTIDSTMALNMAFIVNAAILIMSAATFYRHGLFGVAEIQDAYKLLAPILGTTLAPVAFAVALLAAGQSSTITGTLAGQIVMEGFLNLRIPPWVRRMTTRLLAIVPAVVTIVYLGEHGTGWLLVLSQVVLSLQLPFAIIPLIHFVSDRDRMGHLAIRPLSKVMSWIVAALIVSLNAKLVLDTLSNWIGGAKHALWLELTLVPAVGIIGLFLVYITVKPWLARFLLGPGDQRIGIHKPEVDLDQADLHMAPLPFRKVAVALDFSGRDVGILRETIRFLGSQRPEIALLHVTESAPARFMGKEAGDIESKRDHDRLETYAASLRSAGFVVTTTVGHGKPVTELTRLITDFGADLVVLGAHGHRFFLDLLFGSTADKLRHQIMASVLVVGRGGGSVAVNSRE
jgi:manganese transport protein